MRCEWEKIDDKYILTAEVTADDIYELNLDNWDKQMLKECGASNNPSDWLLALEMLFRRRFQFERKLI